MSLSDLLSIGNTGAVKVKATVCGQEFDLNIKKKTAADDAAEFSKMLELGLIDKKGIATGDIAGIHQLQAFRVARYLTDEGGNAVITETDALSKSFEWLDDVANAIIQNYSPNHQSIEDAAKN